MRVALAAVAACTVCCRLSRPAHVTIAPPFVQDGIESTIAFQTPNERPPHATVRPLGDSSARGRGRLGAKAPAGLAGDDLAARR